MSCNTKTSLAAVIDAVNAQLNNNYIDRDDPRIDQGVFTEPTIRGGLMLDEAAKLDFCGYVTECGQQAPFGKQWLDRPLYSHNTLVSYEDEGEIKSRWEDIDDIVAAIKIAPTAGTIARTLRDINAESESIHSFGECGNGEDDTAVFNLAMSTLSSLAKADGMPRVLRLIAGKTYILKNAKYYPLVDLVCVDGMATLKRPDVPEGTLESVAKWWRIIDSAASGAAANWDSDLAYSHRCSIRNIIFDGNMENARWSGGYQQEQASCLFIAGKKIEGEPSKRVKFLLENIVFKNSVSDGLHFQVNTDIIANNIEAEKCFRGGLTGTGGNSIIRVNGWISRDARFDCEIDAAGSDGIRTAEYYISNYYQDVDNENGKDNIFVSGMDIGGIGQDGVLVFKNVHVGTGPFNWISTGNPAVKSFKKYVMEDCSFVIGGLALQNPLNIQVRNTKFIIDNRDRDKTYGGFQIAMTVSGNRAEQEIVFELDNIKFSALDPDLTNVTGALFTIQSHAKADKKLLKVINSDFSDFDHSGNIFAANVGAKIYVDNLTFASNRFFTGSGIYSSGNYPVELTLGRLTFKKPETTFIHLTSSGEEGGYLHGPASLGNKITFLPGFTIPVENSIYPYAHPYPGTFAKYIGHMNIVGDTPPTETTFSYKGGVYTSHNMVEGMPYEWVTTKSVLRDGNAQWKATKWISGSFQTEDLPILTNFDIGVRNFDTTKNRFVTWNGTEWVEEVSSIPALPKLVQVTSEDLQSASNDINTLNKEVGDEVFNTTNSLKYYATGTAPTSTWKAVDGSDEITPA